MSFYDFVCWHTCFPVKTVNILSEQFQQKTFIRKQTDKGMRDCWPVFARIQLVGEGVKGYWIVSEKRYVKDSLWIGQIESREIGIKTGIWGSKIWNTGRCADASPSLSKITRQFVRPESESSMVFHFLVSKERLTMTTIFVARPSLMYSATESTDLSLRVRGGMLSPIGEDCS